MSNMLLSKVFIPSSSTLKVNPLKSRLKGSHDHKCQLVKLVNLYRINSKTRPSRTISTIMNFGVSFIPKNNYLHVVNVVDYDTNQYTLADLRNDNVPKNVAIILDGSRRWLKAHGKPLTYDPFFEANLLFADLCIKYKIGTATSFVYSLKNLERGKEANDLIFGQLEKFLEHNAQQFHRKGIRICVIGERRELPQTLQNKIRQVEDTTRDCTKLEFMLAVCYAGTRDIVKATRNICDKVSNGLIEAKAIDETLLENELSTSMSRSPQIDLLIRTGGRLRVSDYLMWQIAQSELYFTDLCAPEFGELEFIEALRSFQHRERTFGK